MKDCYINLHSMLNKIENMKKNIFILFGNKLTNYTYRLFINCLERNWMVDNIPIKTNNIYNGTYTVARMSEKQNLETHPTSTSTFQNITIKHSMYGNF